MLDKRYLVGVESWETASDCAREAFRAEMIIRWYGGEETRDAWGWFYVGWCARNRLGFDVLLNP